MKKTQNEQNIPSMLMDGITIMHALLDDETRKSKTNEEIKTLIAINNSLTTASKTYIQAMVVNRAIQNSQNNNIALIHEYEGN